MTTDLDTTQIVRSWLRAGERDSADRILDDVLDLLDATPQRAAVRPRATLTTLGLGAAAAALVVAVVGLSLLPSLREAAVPNATASPSPSAPGSPSPGPGTASPIPMPFSGAIEPGRYAIRWLPEYPVPWPEARILVDMPAGWWSTDNGMTIFKEDGYPGPESAPIVSVHTVSRVLADLCAPKLQPVAVGPTVEDLTTALNAQRGRAGLGPVDVTLGGYPAMKFVPVARCLGPGPEGLRFWTNATGTDFVLWQDGTATVYVVDVSGDRLVITSQHRDAPPGDVAELEAIVGSLVIAP